MSGLRYTVSIQCIVTPGDWDDLAAFRWFADARAHALRTTKGDKLNRFVRISFADGRESLYFRGGVSADHLFEEAA